MGRPSVRRDRRPEVVNAGATVVPLASLTPDPDNRRTHSDRNLAMIGDALRQVGAARSIVIDEDDVILAGNGVTTAAIAAGLTSARIIDAAGDELIAVRRRGLTPDQKRALALFDNRTAELAAWNLELLRVDADAGLELQPFWTAEELAALFGQTAERRAGLTDPDAIPSARATTIKVGDVFALGEHRLACGDATSAALLAELHGSDLAQLIVTSPPYAEQRREQYGGVPADEYGAWFAQVEHAVRPILHDRGSFVLNIKPHVAGVQRSLYVNDLVAALVRTAGWYLVDEFIWLRTGVPMQVTNRFKNAFEPLYWFTKSPEFTWYPDAVRHPSDAVPIALGPDAGETNWAKRQGKGGGAIQGKIVAPGLAYPSNVLDYRENAPALGHPAAFPVRLPTFFVHCMTKAGDRVTDPFGGSGTTLIACEQTGRRAVTTDADPAFCQIAIDRWEAFTGHKAERLTPPRRSPRQKPTPKARKKRR